MIKETGVKKVEGTCSGCEYWRHQAGNAQSEPSVIKGAPPKTSESGLCYYEQPKFIVRMTVQENAITRQQIPTQVIERYYPQTLEHEFCASNPDRLKNREYGLELLREKARRDLVTYNPAKYGDANAGFSQAPTLAIAKKLAVVQDGRNQQGDSDAKAT